MSAATRGAVTLAISNLVEAMLNYHAWLAAPGHARHARHAVSREEHQRIVEQRQADLDEALADHERSILEQASTL